MTQTELARAAGLGQSTIVDFEKERRVVSDQAIASIQAALEAVGVIFLADGEEGPGVRLRKERL